MRARKSERKYDESELIDRSRNLFLQTVREHKKEVLESLAAEPFELYRKRWARDRATRRREDRRDALYWNYNLTNRTVRPQDIDKVKEDFALGPSGYNPDVRRLFESLFAWARAWHLDATWCVYCALLTLQRWHVNGRRWHLGETSVELPWTLYAANPSLPGHPPEPPAGLPEWDLFYKEETLKEYLARVEASARDQIANNPLLSIGELSHREAFIKTIPAAAAQYVKEVEGWRDVYGWRPITGKPRLKDHILWALRFQVKEESYDDIADSCGEDPSTVRMAVRRTLKLVGLKKRALKRGRKKDLG